MGGEDVGGRVGGEVEVCGDEEIALDAAFRGGPGILVIGGTGSIVVGRMRGWDEDYGGRLGAGIGDEGSGYWIGREAVRQAFRRLIEAVQTGLLEAIRVAWGAKDLGEVVGIANARPGPDFAGLVPVVVRCAEQGDDVAAASWSGRGWSWREQVRWCGSGCRQRG